MNLYESVRNDLEIFLANKDKITNWRLKYKGFYCYCGAIAGNTVSFRGEEPGYEVFDKHRDTPKEPLVRRTYNDIDLSNIDVDKFLKKVERDLKSAIDAKVGIKESEDVTNRTALGYYTISNIGGLLVYEVNTMNDAVLVGEEIYGDKRPAKWCDIKYDKNGNAYFMWGRTKISFDEIMRV